MTIRTPITPPLPPGYELVCVKDGVAEFVHRYEEHGASASDRYTTRKAPHKVGEVVSVKAERLCDEIHKEAEGCDLINHPEDLQAVMSEICEWTKHWNNEHPEHPWESNPWVWVMEVKEL